MAVQSALRQRHDYHEQVDGFFGQATAIAIERFQMDHDLYVKGVIESTVAPGARNNRTLNSPLDCSKAKIVRLLGIRC
jgi:peptidoglycan hydrolase-like protein with peptidoglycan-binding domain